MNTLPRLDNGQLASYAWPGGYPLYYFDAENSILCPSCANKEGYNAPIIGCDINYENTVLYCDDCSAHIEAAYEE
jgi:hypothetical protein